MYGHVDNPVAYENAKAARIRANANKTRRAKLVAALEQEPDLLAWLDYELTPEETRSLNPIWEQAKAEVEATISENARPWLYERVHDRAGSLGYFEKRDALLEARRKRLGPVPSFLLESLREWAGLTEKQLAFARKIYHERCGKAETRDAERDAEDARRRSATPWTAGRQTVEGVIIAEKSVEGQWGVTYKCLVKCDDGKLLWGTVPTGSKTKNEYGVTEREFYGKGDRVRFTAALEPKQGDETFAFYSRPTKPVLVAKATNPEGK